MDTRGAFLGRIILVGSFERKMKCREEEDVYQDVFRSCLLGNCERIRVIN